MSDQSLDDAERIFDEAIDLPPEDRRAHVERACGEDSALRECVLRLLAADAIATDAALPSPSMWLPPDTLARGQTVAGRYRLLEPIGEGGLGVVWRAEQFIPLQRTVALKFVRHDLGGRHIASRFAMERTALSLMDHPGIARIHDAGVAEGDRPFVAMELVAGEPITAACDGAKATIHDRVRLFAEVCRAVHHAHQRGILHRDLKPSNILATEVDGRLAPKVIDFGIAKAMTSDLLPDRTETRVGQIVGTPAYMAPEQLDAGSRAIDVRADIFALGVVFHELLSGALPRDRSSLSPAGSALRPERSSAPGPSATLRSLGREEAARVSDLRRETPASLKRRLHGELDWIVGKARADEPDRRYASASEFAADLERWLAGEPVMAGPPGIRYRTRAFVRRNATAVAVAALLVATLLFGLLGTTVGLLRARDAESNERMLRAIAESEAARAARGAYAAQIAAAGAALVVEDAEAAKRVLDSTDPALRGWEWRWLQGRADQSERTLPVGAGQLYAVDLTPDEASLLVTAQDRNLHVVDLESWSVVERIPTGLSNGVGLEVAPDGSRVVVQGASDAQGARVEFRLLDWPSGRVLSSGDGLFRSGGVAPDGRVFAVTGDVSARLTLFDLASGRVASTVALPANLAGALASFGETSDEILLWTPGRTAAARIRVVDGALDPESLKPFEVPALERGTFVLRGAFFVGADSETGTAMIGTPEEWSLARRIASPRRHGRLRDIALSPDGSVAIISAEAGGAMRIQDLRSDTLVAMLHGHLDRVIGTRFFADGRRFVTVGFDGTARLWDLDALRSEFRVSATDPTGRLAAAFDADATLLASGGWGEVQLFRAKTGELLWTRYLAARYVERLAFSPDGSRLAIAETNGRALILAVADGSIERELPSIPAGHSGLLWDPADRWIALAGGDGTLLFVDPDDGRSLRSVRPVEGALTALACSPDGSLIAVGTGGLLLAGDNWARILAGPDATPELVVLRADDGEILARTPWEAGVSALRFDADGCGLFVGASDGSLARVGVGPGPGPGTGPEGSVRIAGDSDIRWSLGGAVPFASSARSADRRAFAEIRALHVDRTGGRLVVGQRTGGISILRPDDPNVFLTLHAPAPVHACAFDAESDELLVAGQEPLMAFPTRPRDAARIAARRRVAAIRSVVDPIIVDLRLAEEVIARLAEDPTIDDSLRADALAYATARGEHQILMVSQVMERARQPLLPRDAAERDLRWLERVREQRPEMASGLAPIMAVLHLRLGAPERAKSLVAPFLTGSATDAPPSLATLAIAGLAELDRGDRRAAEALWELTESRIEAGEPLNGEAPWYLAEMRRRIEAPKTAP